MTTLTVNGRIGKLDVIYAVGYLDRDMESLIDYSAYTNGGGYQVYYLCPGYADDGTWARTGAAGTPVTCHDPEAQYIDNNSNKRVTQEFRVSMPDEFRMRVTAGAFFDEQTTRGTASFEDAATRDDGDGAWPALGMIGDAAEGTNADGELFNPRVSFVNDYTRKTEQMALFGQLDFDITPTVTASFGARWYDIDFDFKGASTFSFRCKYSVDGCDNSDKYPERTPFPDEPRGSDVFDPTTPGRRQ